MQPDVTTAAGASWAPRVWGRVDVPAECDPDRLLGHLAAALRDRGCAVRLLPGGCLAVDSGSAGRGSVLAFVDGGTVRLSRSGDHLDYEFTTAGGLLLCAILSPLCGGLAWFTLGSAGLAVFGLLMPLVWLFGANYLTTVVRVRGFLARLCAAAPQRLAAPWGRP